MVVGALVLNKNDLRSVAVYFDEPLYDTEVDVVSEHPFRASRLMEIRDKAQKESRRARKRDSSVPEDAYRHVLWSYLLTKEYGPEFAEKVTDAHELGASDNTEADHRMDYNNNKIGRSYALRGEKESNLLDNVRTDPKVIRVP